MYDPNELLAQIDAHTAGILLLAGGAMIGNYVWFIAALRAGARDRVFSLPLFCTLFWFAHDVSFTYRFDKWFNTYDHWYTKLFWVGLLGAVAFELAFFAQIFRYGRQELLPSWSQRRFNALIVAAAAAAFPIWEMFKYVMDDDLYAASFGITIASYPLFGAALLIRRGSRAGQDQWMWGSFSVMAALLFTAFALYYGDPFHSWQWISLGVLSTGGGLAITYVIGRLPRLEPAQQAASAPLRRREARSPQPV